MTCKTIKPNISKICEGDFNRKIKIQYTASIANNKPNTNAGTSFKDLKEVWAMVKTNINADFVQNVNVERTLNIDFYIRYTASIDFERELWVEFNNNRYKVGSVDNIDKRNELIRLRASERGKKTVQANQR
jgi:SPP1 family predicted phage head-tail adaptor